MSRSARRKSSRRARGCTPTRGDLPRALAVLEQGIMEYPDNVDLRYAMASTYEEQGRISDALHELTELLKARPDDPAALNALGYTLADHSKRSAAGPRAHRARLRRGAEECGDSRQPGLGAVPPGPCRGGARCICGRLIWMIAAATSRRIWARYCGSSAGPTTPSAFGPRPASVDADNRLLKATRQRLHALPQTQPPVHKPPPVTTRPLPVVN